MCDPYVVFLAYVGVIAGSLLLLVLIAAIRRVIIEERSKDEMGGD